MRTHANAGDRTLEPPDVERRSVDALVAKVPDRTRARRADRFLSAKRPLRVGKELNREASHKPGGGLGPRGRSQAACLVNPHRTR